MTIRSVVIVGANLAGGHTATRLRERGFEGRIVLVGAEPHLPYERPPLSKSLLEGATTADALQIWTEQHFADVSIDVVLGHRVDRLSARDQRVQLSDGRTIEADRVVLCTGARPRRLTLPGADLPGTCELRTIEDALYLKSRLLPGAHVAIVGAGFIGAELAAVAAAAGCLVTVVEANSLPLLRVLGPELAGIFADMHRAHGVNLLTDSGVARVLGEGACRGIELSDGRQIEADTVLFGVGALPATELAEQAGITIDNGIVVDEHCRTSIPEVLAAGDVAARPTSHASRPIRPESWQNAQDQGIAAADSILGSRELFDPVPWFWSDQYDVKLQIAGIPEPSDAVVWRGDPTALKAVAFYTREGTVRAAVGLNRPREVRGAMDLVRSGTRVSADQLADEDVDLRRLAARDLAAK